MIWCCVHHSLWQHQTSFLTPCIPASMDLLGALPKPGRSCFAAGIVFLWWGSLGMTHDLPAVSAGNGTCPLLDMALPVGYPKMARKPSGSSSVSLLKWQYWGFTPFSDRTLFCYFTFLLIYPTICIYEYIWVYMSIYEYIWVYMSIYEYIWVYMSIYEYIWVYMSICIYTNIQIYTNIYMYLCFCVFVYMCVCVYVYIYIYSPMKNGWFAACKYMYMYMYICIYVYVYVIYICMYICICIYPSYCPHYINILIIQLIIKYSPYILIILSHLSPKYPRDIPSKSPTQIHRNKLQ